MEILLTPEILIAFLTLTLLELVLGIDNVIFISILVDKLPKHQREFARKLGLFMAMFINGHTLSESASRHYKKRLSPQSLLVIWKSTLDQRSS